MTQQVTLPEFSGKLSESVIIHPATLTAELPRAVRGYSVESVDRLVAELESRQTVLQSKLAKAEEGNKRLIEDLSQCATELAAFREKESTLLSALLAVEERKQSIGVELDSSRVAAQQQIRDLVERATLETERLRSDAQIQAKDIIDRAQLDVEAIKAGVDGIEEKARSRANEIMENASEEAERIKAGVAGAEITARAKAEEILSQAEASAEKIITDAASRRQEYIADADEMLESARAEAAAVKSQAAAESETILSNARSQAESLVASAQAQVKDTTKDIDSAAAAKSRQLAQLNAEFRKTVALIRQTAQKQLASLPAEGEEDAVVEDEDGASTKFVAETDFRMDTTLATA